MTVVQKLISSSFPKLSPCPPLHTVDTNNNEPKPALPSFLLTGCIWLVFLLRLLLLLLHAVAVLRMKIERTPSTSDDADALSGGIATTSARGLLLQLRHCAPFNLLIHYPHSMQYPTRFVPWAYVQQQQIPWSSPTNKKYPRLCTTQYNQAQQNTKAPHRCYRSPAPQLPRNEIMFKTRAARRSFLF